MGNMSFSSRKGAVLTLAALTFPVLGQQQPDLRSDFNLRYNYPSGPFEWGGGYSGMGLGMGLPFGGAFSGFQPTTYRPSVDMNKVYAEIQRIADTMPAIHAPSPTEFGADKQHRREVVNNGLVENLEAPPVLPLPHGSDGGIGFRSRERPRIGIYERDSYVRPPSGSAAIPLRPKPEEAPGSIGSYESTKPQKIVDGATSLVKELYKEPKPGIWGKLTHWYKLVKGVGKVTDELSKSARLIINTAKLSNQVASGELDQGTIDRLIKVDEKHLSALDRGLLATYRAINEFYEKVKVPTYPAVESARFVELTEDFSKAVKGDNALDILKALSGLRKFGGELMEAENSIRDRLPALEHNHTELSRSCELEDKVLIPALGGLERIIPVGDAFAHAELISPACHTAHGAARVAHEQHIMALWGVSYQRYKFTQVYEQLSNEGLLKLRDLNDELIRKQKH